MMKSDDVQIKFNNICKIEYIPKIENKPLNITLEELENEINQMIYYGQNPKYGFNKIYDQQLEHSYIPTFIDSFYNYIFEYGKMPSQKELWDYYLSSNKEYLTVDNEYIHVNFMCSHFTADRKCYLARCLRSYPSLLRDFHFIMMLSNNEFLKDKFFYSLENDYNKIDIEIKYNDKVYKIGLDVNTKRCNEFREKKQNRHEEDDVCYFSIDLNKGRRIGRSLDPDEQFIVYPDSILNDIKEMISK